MRYENLQQAVADVSENAFRCIAEPGMYSIRTERIDALRVALRESHMSVNQQVTAFHRAFGLPIAPSPTIPPEERMRLRARLITEEVLEFMEAVFPRASTTTTYLREVFTMLINLGIIEVDMPAMADALGDIDYVVEGTRLEFGINGAPIAAEIQRSNMAKLGPDGKPILRADGKVQKPANWTLPDIAGELRKQGWNPNSLVAFGIAALENKVST